MTADSPQPGPDNPLASLAEGTAEIDPAFADQLEARLRTQHGGRDQASAVGLNRRLVLGVAAAVVAMIAVFGLSQLRGDDAVSVEVAEPTAEATRAAAASGGGDEDDPDREDPGFGGGSDQQDPSALLDGSPTTTPTAIPQPAAATATPIPTQPDPAPTVPAVANDPVPATVVAEPTLSPAPTSPPATAPPSTPTGTAVPTTTAAPTTTPLPTAAVEPEPSGTPVPTSLPTVVPEPVPTATPDPTPTTTPTVPPIEVDLECDSLVNDRGARVRCTWTATTDNVERWELLRIRNGGPRNVIATARPATVTLTDDQVRVGDMLIYAVRGMRGDDAVVTSEPVLVTVE